MDQNRENFRRYAIIRFLNENNLVSFSDTPPIGFFEILHKWETRLPSINKSMINLYVHFPFCPKKCRYCYCASRVPSGNGEAENYISSLIKEMESYKKTFLNTRFRSLWIGGGTPSFMTPEQLGRVFNAIYSNFKFCERPQVNIEVSPATLSNEKIEIMKKNRVNRVTLGIQSTDEQVIQKNNRLQSAEQVKKAMESLKKAGIPCINTDLLCGIEGQTPESFIRTLKEVISLEPNIIHIFPFLDSPCTEFRKDGRLLGSAELENIKKMMRQGRETLNNAGYFNEKYEEGFVKGVNSLNLTDHDFARFNASLLGIGEGARSHIFGDVWGIHTGYSAEPSRSTSDIKFITANSSIIREAKIYIFNNIKHGLDFEEFKNLFGESVMGMFGKEMGFLQENGVVKVMGNSAILSEKGHKLVVAAYLFDDKDSMEMADALGIKYSAGADYGKKSADYLKKGVLR